MVLFYSSRTAARAVSFGVLHDAGPEAPRGKRYGRKVSAVSGNAKQRRQTIRAMMRNA